MSDSTKLVGPFKESAEFATNLGIAIALHQAIKEFEGAKDSMSKEMAQVQLDILCQVLLVTDLVAEA